VALFHVLPLSHLLPSFPVMMLSSLHLVIFRHLYLIHMKSDFRNFYCYEFNTSFSLHLPFRFKKKILPSILRRFYGVTSPSRYPLVEIILYENQDDICFLWDLGLWILTIQPSHSYTLAYCKPFHLISIEFQNIILKVIKHIKFTREMLKDQLHLCKIQKITFETM
jgi:hypothetical protein